MIKGLYLTKSADTLCKHHLLTHGPGGRVKPHSRLNQTICGARCTDSSFVRHTDRAPVAASLGKPPRERDVSIETLARACALLSRMPAANPWNEGFAELYAVGLRALPDHIMMDVVSRAIMTCPSRPTVPELMALAAEMLCGFGPIASEAWEEVERFLTARGLYCRQDPEHPNIFREGEPAFSHPFIARTVQRLGGWRALCASELGLSALSERFCVAYEETVDRAFRATRESLSPIALELDLTMRGHSTPRRAALRVASSG